MPISNIIPIPNIMTPQYVIINPNIETPTNKMKGEKTQNTKFTYTKPGKPTVAKSLSTPTEKKHGQTGNTQSTFLYISE